MRSSTRGPATRCPWPSDNSADLAARVETGFISDSQDIDYILSHPHLLADAIAQSVIDSLEAK